MLLCMCIWVGVGAYVQCIYIRITLYVLYIWGILLGYGGGGGGTVVSVFLCSAFR